MNKQLPLILASVSPRRKLILKEAGFRFRVVPSHIRERHPRGVRPSDLVRSLALAKAVSVAKQCPAHEVLGADTIVYIGKTILGKPQNPSHAKQILRKLSGSWQRVYTGVAVVSEGGRKRKTGVAITRVKFRPLTEKDIERASRRHLDKAGAYAIQEGKDPFVQRIVGDYDNVVGLPMRVVKSLLARLRGA